jgi:hypothetical protein
MLLADLERSSNGLIMETVRLWEVVHGPLREGVVAWHVWAPLGKAMVQGAWKVDVSSCFRRDNARGTLGPPVQISPRLMRHFLTLPCHHMARHQGGLVEASSTGKGSRVCPISLQRVVRASRFSRFEEPGIGTLRFRQCTGNVDRVHPCIGR